MAHAAAIIVISYLLGSIPFGYLLVRIFRGEDVRRSGSGNIGATNVSRKSPVLGIVTLLLDALKGSAAVALGMLLSPPLFERISLAKIPWREILPASSWPTLVTWAALAALFAILGHMFPVWLKFRGGKGVATSLGAFLLLTPKTILCLVALFILLAVAFRYVSLGSIAVAAAFPLLAWALGEYREPLDLLFIAIVSVLVIWKHRQNITRLTSGTEARIGHKAAPAAHNSGESR